ncbi:MAG: YrhK family protein [Geminicoccaceae bacterium]
MFRLFDPAHASRSARHARLYALYEILFTIADFSAAFLFIIGSILFFREQTVTLGTWMFLIGSVFFALKPSIRLAREVHYWRLGDVDLLAERAQD